MRKFVGWIPKIGIGATLLLLGVGFASVLINNPIGSSEVAGWIQAIGSIFAIIGAFQVAENQFKQNARSAIENEQRSREERRIAISLVIRQCYAQIAGLPGGKFSAQDMETYLKLVPKAHFQNLEKLLSAAPLYDIGDQIVVRCVLDMMATMDRTRRFLEFVAEMDPDLRTKEWPGLAKNIDEIQALARLTIRNLENRDA